jgi:hypothetical protein
MVCGAELIYPDPPAATPCAYCGESSIAEATCADGHFVCDACHVAEGRAVVERTCLSTDETDMIALLQRIRSHPAIPVHGPEHHAMVPGIIVATYRNLGGRVEDDQVREAIRRGSKLPGGHCAFLGGCAAALGTGIAFGVILRATPTEPGERGVVNRVSAAAMAAVGEQDAARCCQRDAWISLRSAAESSEELLPVALKAEAPLRCTQRNRNPECAKKDCPLFRPEG